MNRVNSSNFKAKTVKFSEKFDNTFSHVFIFGNTFLRVTASLLFRLQPASKIHDPIYPYLISDGKRNCSTLWLSATKPWLSANMLPNIKTYENVWSNFSENLKIVALKLLELTQFASPNLSMYFHFIRCRRSVLMITFLN